MISIDWLSVYQDFPPASLPIFSDAVVLQLDNEGVLQKEFLKSFKHDGSFSTCLMVKCDGTRVTMSGNPSKYCRLDNIFGVSDMDSAFRVFNRVLVGLGLPAFGNDLPATFTSRLQLQTSDAVMLDRPVITRVDLCQNYGLGDQVYSFMDWVGNQSVNGKSGHRYADGCTVDFGRGSRYVYCKYYVKGVELERHARKLKENDDKEYLGQLVDWCTSVGLVRFEISLKSMLLKRLGLDNWSEWGHKVMGEVVTKYAAHFRLGSGSTAKGHPFDSLVGDLVQKGVDRKLADKCEVAARAWLSGSDVRARYSRATFYRLRKPLLLVGIDLTHRCDVRTLLPQVREFSIRDVSPPSFYKTAIF